MFDSGQRVVFVNVRRFGRMFLCRDDPTKEEPVRSLGYDVLTDLSSEDESCNLMNWSKILVDIGRRKVPVSVQQYVTISCCGHLMPECSLHFQSLSL